MKYLFSSLEIHPTHGYQSDLYKLQIKLNYLSADKIQTLLYDVKGPSL